MAETTPNFSVHIDIQCLDTNLAMPSFPLVGLFQHERACRNLSLLTVSVRDFQLAARVIIHPSDVRMKAMHVRENFVLMLAVIIQLFTKVFLQGL